jgi:hypothetical protein
MVPNFISFVRSLMHGPFLGVINIQGVLHLFGSFSSHVCIWQTVGH